ncbi:hypothetical protein [Frigoriglobus tundricola]|uniref:Uncharacterized protein n=1 Tax=Frigoriglobus tundricola TaxID=2774151 RepID=A0A6M5YMC2_9BACT|nr:hypothetical protein [Frigoriglobus tundricola]QJW94744.1 hypothetical protein FTUN_2266 [Frigoriglobus tundricola]
MQQPSAPLALPNYAAWLTTETLAKQAGVSPIVANGWIVNGIKTETGRIRLTAVKVGGRWRINPDAVAAFFAATTKASLPASAATDVPPPPAPPSEADIRRRGEECMARLRAGGLLMDTPTRTRRS